MKQIQTNLIFKIEQWGRKELYCYSLLNVRPTEYICSYETELFMNIAWEQIFKVSHAN